MDIPAPAVTGTANAAADRLFDLAELGDPLGVLPRGLLVQRTGRAMPPTRSGGRSGQVIAASDQQQLVHVPMPHGSLAAAGLAVARRGRTLGVVLHQGGNADPAKLPLAFAIHLDNRRRRDTQPVRPCVTSAIAPELVSTPSLVRLPHLVTVRDSTRSLSDTVVWEVMTITQARRWLGGPLPGQSLFEQQLPALLQVRFLSRAGQLPPSDEGQCLRELLTGRYLSIRLVYRHPALFAALIRAVVPPPVSGGTGD
ncbi:MAG TPA: hypothetical protein VGA04_17835 [Streptosporangiaceae bacterium]